MYEYYFTFRSMTRAQLAVQRLNGRGIGAVLVRIPKSIAAMGCGYAVRVQKSDAYLTSAALHAAGIGFERVFGVNYDGEAKEVPL